MNQDFFKSNPLLKEYYQTADGKKFYTENAAQNHAKTKKLDDKTVKHVERSKSKEATESKPVEKALSKMKKAELVALATSLGLEVTDQTNVELVALIEAAQNNTNAPVGEKTAE